MSASRCLSATLAAAAAPEMIFASWRKGAPLLQYGAGMSYGVYRDSKLKLESLDKIPAVVVDLVQVVHSKRDTTVRKLAEKTRRDTTQWTPARSSSEPMATFDPGADHAEELRNDTDLSTTPSPRQLLAEPPAAVPMLWWSSLPHRLRSLRKRRRISNPSPSLPSLFVRSVVTALKRTDAAP